MSSEESAALEAGIVARVRQAVADLNNALSEADQAGLEAEIQTVEHQTVGSASKRLILSARLMRPIVAA